MNDNAKVFSLIEMREMMIDTSDYQMMEEVGEFTGTLEMKAQGHKKSIRQNAEEHLLCGEKRRADDVQCSP